MSDPSYQRPVVTILVTADDDPLAEDELELLGPIGALPLPFIHQIEHEYGPRLVEVLGCKIVPVH